MKIKRNNESVYNVMKPKSAREMMNTSKFVTVLQQLENGDKDASELSKAIMLKGKFGCGKSLSAEILARVVNKIGPDEDISHIYHKINAKDLLIADIRSLGQTILNHHISFDGLYSVYVFEEAHNFSRDVQEYFQVLLDKLKGYVFIVFTTTAEESKFLKPLRSRFLTYNFHGLSYADFELYATNMLELMNVKGNMKKAELRELYSYTGGIPRLLLIALEEVRISGSINLNAIKEKLKDVKKGESSLRLDAFLGLISKGQIDKINAMYEKMLEKNSPDTIHVQLLVSMNKMAKSAQSFKKNEKRIFYMDWIDRMVEVQIQMEGYTYSDFFKALRYRALYLKMASEVIQYGFNKREK